ncbi:uncharacterized protein G2W53_010634 [Senna tora]|uniref:DUF4283 domain-containing protein n=1 Tax=Senna tora TaxID=362788 RepID=A0A834WZN3_9FABA|nr:uncharacterized protein G2W53_010634 [Senna tora]
MSDNNSFFELNPNHFSAVSSSEQSSNGTFAPDYLFPRQGPVLHVDDTYVALRRAIWSKRAIAALVDWREIPSFRLQAIINSHWKLQGTVTVKAQVRNFYILDFEYVQDWCFMIKNGPWVVKNSLLVLDKWQPEISAESLRIKNVAVWLRFTGVPLELVCNYVAHSLGDLAGEVVELDPENDSGRRLEFLRVKVLVDPSKPLLMGSYYPLSNGHKVWITCTLERTYRLCEQCEFIHFQCPKRKTAKWHFRESTKIQVHYDEFGPRYEISEEHSPLLNNIISAEWSSDSSSDDQDEVIYIQHTINPGNISPENGSPPSVGNQHLSTAVHGSLSATPHNVLDNLQYEETLNVLSQPPDDVHVVHAEHNGLPNGSNHCTSTEPLNEADPTDFDFDEDMYDGDNDYEPFPDTTDDQDYESPMEEDGPTQTPCLQIIPYNPFCGPGPLPKIGPPGGPPLNTDLLQVTSSESINFFNSLRKSMRCSKTILWKFRLSHPKITTAEESQNARGSKEASPEEPPASEAVNSFKTTTIAYQDCKDVDTIPRNGISVIRFTKKTRTASVNTSRIFLAVIYNSQTLVKVVYTLRAHEDLLVASFMVLRRGMQIAVNNLPHSLTCNIVVFHKGLASNISRGYKKKKKVRVLGEDINNLVLNSFVFFSTLFNLTCSNVTSVGWTTL